MVYAKTVHEKHMELEIKGFTRFAPEELYFSAVEEIAWEKIQRYAKDLPPDPTAPSKRFRAYGKSILINEKLLPTNPINIDGRDVVEYTQPAELNTEQQGQRRFFSAMPKSILENFAIRQLTSLFADVAGLQAKPIMAWQVGMHLVKLVATPGQPSAASPDHLHRDGEPFTFAVLVDRKNVVGGENAIAETRYVQHKLHEVPKLMSKFTLETPLEAYGVNDILVSHHVEKVSCAAGHNSGSRTVLLIDFTPLLPAIALKAAA